MSADRSISGDGFSTPPSHRSGAASRGLTGRPALDAFLSQWVRDNQILSDLMQLPLSERVRIAVAAEKAMREKKLRAGVDTYVAPHVQRPACELRIHKSIPRFGVL